VSFVPFDLHPRIVAGIRAAGYTTPTPIQLQAMPPILQGRDVIGLAQTGTGKTAAFALPILQRLMQGPRRHVRALIVAPTRELAEQINDATKDLGRETQVRCATVYGGVGMQPQISRLRAGVEIVVACPGRLLDLLGQRAIDLSHVEVLVLDEADRMLDMGFLPDIRRILKQLPSERQTLMFSATMPDDIRRLSGEILRRPVTVQIGHLAPVETVSHALYPVPEHLKTSLLTALLRATDTDSVLVFARTKHRAKRLAEHLVSSGFSAACLQGNLSQTRRQAALDGFREGSYQILVATDIAARGIDVTRISHVINYDMPDTADAYTHRIGRTGRVERLGDAFTLITAEDAEMVQAVERVVGVRLERRKLAGFDYSAAAPARVQGRRPATRTRESPATRPLRESSERRSPWRTSARPPAGRRDSQPTRRPRTG